MNGPTPNCRCTILMPDDPGYNPTQDPEYLEWVWETVAGRLGLPVWLWFLEGSEKYNARMWWRTALELYGVNLEGKI